MSSSGQNVSSSLELPVSALEMEGLLAPFGQRNPEPQSKLDSFGRLLKGSIFRTALKNALLVSTWYFLSTCLTLYNKAFLGKHHGFLGMEGFPAPLFMTAVQFIIQWSICGLILWTTCCVPKAEDTCDWYDWLTKVGGMLQPAFGQAYRLLRTIRGGRRHYQIHPNFPGNPAGTAAGLPECCKHRFGHWSFEQVPRVHHCVLLHHVQVYCPPVAPHVCFHLRHRETILAAVWRRPDDILRRCTRLPR